MSDEQKQMTIDDEQQGLIKRESAEIEPQRPKGKIQFYEIVREITEPTDWIDFGGDNGCWPSSRATNRIMAYTGCSAENVDSGRVPVRNDQGEETGYYEFFCMLKVHRPDGVFFDVEGTCSMADDNHCRRKDRDGKYYYLKPAKVDIHKVKAIARTRALRKGIATIFGITQMPREKLQQFTGWDEGEMRKIKRGKW